MITKTPRRSHSSELRPRPSESDARTTRSRRAYEAPRLEVLGDIRALTLGATAGLGDSSPPNTQPF